MGLKVNNEKCFRCGMCASTFIGVFEFNDDGEIEVNNDKITEENEEEIKEFMNSCPAGAIEEEKKDTNE